MNAPCMEARPAANDPPARFALITAVLAAATITIFVTPQAQSWLAFDRTAIATGQVWRIFTCHFTHYSTEHLVWDLATFVFLGLLCEHDGRRRFVATLIGAVVLIPLAVAVALPDMANYRGLSGIDSALFALLAVTVLREKIAERAWVWVAGIALVVAGFVAKIAFETQTGATVFMDSASAALVPVPLAHIVGGLVGVACGTVRLTHADREAGGLSQGGPLVRDASAG